MLCMSTLLIQLKSPNSELSKTLKRIENHSNIEVVMSQNVLTMSALLIHLKSPDSELSKTF